MKRTHLIATIVGLMAIAVASQDALARGRMYHPGLGVFMQRDPVGTATAPPMARNLSASQYTRRDPTVQYADGMNLYQYVRSNPANRRDWTGLGSECYCGPDVTGFLVDLVNYAGKWRVKQGAISRPQGIAWLQANGVNLDWWSRTYKIKSCPSKGKPCKNTYWLCGECVHDHWIGNFMYGYLGRLLSLPDWMPPETMCKVRERVMIQRWIIPTHLGTLLAMVWQESCTMN